MILPHRNPVLTAKMLATVCYQQGKLPETEKSYRESGVAYTKCNAVASADFTEWCDPWPRC